ncbi:MAG: cytochrome P450, partial [Gammaproteobacteria bacterium]
MSNHNYPPGPEGKGKLGCLPEMRANPMEFLENVAKQYGGSYKQVRMVIGEGILLSEGDVWRRQRTHAQPKFTAKSLDEHTDWIAGLAADFLKAWDANVKASKPIELEYQFNLLTQLIAGAWVMGEGFKSRAQTVFNIYNQIRMNWPEMTDLRYSFLKPKNLKKEINFRKALSNLNKCVYGLLDEYPEIVSNDNGFLRSLLPEGVEDKTAIKKYIKSNRRSLRDQLLTLFVT